jgi:hypothetical protein
MTELRLSVSSPTDDDAARELAEWLVSDDALYGNVRLTAPVVPDGAMGAVLSEIAVLLGPGGVAMAFASVLITWLRRRSGSVSVRITRSDGSEVRLAAENVRALTPDEVRAQVTLLAAEIALEAGSGGDGGS